MAAITSVNLLLEHSNEKHRTMKSTDSLDSTT